ncbi:MAG: FAD-binding protein [Spongiibacteraceae bacterium]
MSVPNKFDHEVDVLVVGSGNGAFTAALACHDLAKADVLMIDKSHKFGGTSALSGGGVWVPNNRYAKEAGAQDSYEDALEYLQNTIPGDMVDSAMLEAYLQAAPEMIDFIHDNTRLKYKSLAKYPDYFTNLPGAREGHRSMEPLPIAFSELARDDEDKMLDGGAMYMFFKYAITQVDAQAIVCRTKGWKFHLARRILSYYLDIPWLLRRKGFSRRTTGGGAGIIRLFLSLRDRGMKLWLKTSLEDLILEDGKVVGAVINKEGIRLNIRAKKGVVLAAGGFEHNQEMRERYLPKPTSTKWTAGCKTNTGDAIRIGIKAGAAVALMDNAWWCTTKVTPERPYPMLSVVNKSLPGSIVVNKAGARFSNESQNYISFLKEAFKAHTDENPCAPMYMVFDSDFRQRRSSWPASLPDRAMPESYRNSGFFASADSIDELASKMGIDAEGLATTVERFNGFVESGKDLDFKRGDAAYDRYYGDTDFTPNPCLGKILQPPFYAVKLDAGDFGTQGGMVINTHAQVRDTKGEVIAGLYACGNCTAAVLPTYPGPGSTLGPAMTFGYLAAKHIANQ